jgi:hypothetical protein
MNLQGIIKNHHAKFLTCNHPIFKFKKKFNKFGQQRQIDDYIELQEITFGKKQKKK